MRRTLLTLALCCSLTQVVTAQEQDHAPWLNAFGRFWGIGYSAGYHAHTNSRLGFHHYSPDHNVVPQPPRGQHANPNLYTGQSYAVLQYGNPMAGAMHGPNMAPTMAPSIAPTMAPALMMPQHSQNTVPPPPKPVDPPPNWLKQYMKPGEVEPNRADDLLNDDSPSDRKGVMLTPSLEDSTTSLSITPAQPSIQIGGRPVISVMQQ